MYQLHRYNVQKVFPARANVSFEHNALVQWLFIVTVLVNILIIIGLAFFVHPSDDLLRLQYNVYFGTSLHAPWWGAYVLPGIGLAFILIDMILAYILYMIHERIAAYIILLGVVFVHIALAVAALSVVLNNF